MVRKIIFHLSFSIFHWPVALGLPLPLGEGWGEGVANQKVLASSFFLLRKLRTLTLALSQREREMNQD